MALDQAIEHGQEHRKPYNGSKRFDVTCRNHGSCPWCKSNRLYFDRRQREYADKQLKEWRKDNG